MRVDHLDIIQIWTETAMHTQYPIINKSTKWQNIEDFLELSPQFYIISSFALVIKTVHPVNLMAFVVSSEEEEVFWVLDFVREEEADGLQTLLPAVHVVAEEEELPRREVHAQLPDVVREEIQVLFRFEERTYTGG